MFEEAEAFAIQDELTPFMRQAHFKVEGALRRIVWATLDDGRVVLRDESRTNRDGPWRTSIAYEFTRVR